MLAADGQTIAIDSSARHLSATERPLEADDDGVPATNGHEAVAGAPAGSETSGEARGADSPAGPATAAGNGDPTGDGPLTIVKIPHPHVTRPRRNATVKEQLDRDDVETMLADDADWVLAVPNDDGTDVLSKDALREAWATDVPGTVTLPLPAVSRGDKALLDDALESDRPKASLARIATAYGVPASSIALLATAAGGLVGATTNVALARPWLLAIAGFFGLCALAISLMSTVALRGDEVYLSRIDLLRERTQPSSFVPLFGGLMFIIALACAVFAVFPTNSDDDAAASFSKHTSVQAGALTRVGFTVGYKNLPADVADVLISVSVPDQQPGQAAMPRQSDGTASQRVAVSVERRSRSPSASSRATARRTRSATRRRTTTRWTS